MLADPKAQDGFRSFTNQWLRVDQIDRIEKDGSVHPDFDNAVARDLRASLEAFLDEVWESGDGRLLYTADFGYVNARLAPIFGLDAADFGEELERVALDPEQRSGLLTHPGLLALNSKANQSDPIHRAKFVRERLLCQHLPSPPDDLTVPHRRVKVSTSSLRRALGDALAAYALMRPHHVADFLDLSTSTVKLMLDAGDIPSIGEGKRRRVDPLDVCVYVLAEREGVTAREYWDTHGEAVPERAARLYRQIRKMQAVA